MRNSPVNIMLVDDHEVVLSGVSRLLSNERKYEIAGTAKSQQDALTILHNKDIDIAIIDLALPELEGIELHRKIKNHAPETKTLIFSMHNSAWVFNELMESGINGYVSKTSSFQELKVAIDEVMLGNYYFCNKIKELYKLLEQPWIQFSNKDLTRREKEIIRLIFKELKTAQIARKLNISKNTVESHRKNIMTKFQVNNSIGIIKKAIERGIINV